MAAIPDTLTVYMGFVADHVNDVTDARAPRQHGVQDKLCVALAAAYERLFRELADVVARYACRAVRCLGRVICVEGTDVYRGYAVDNSTAFGINNVLH